MTHHPVQPANVRIDYSPADPGPMRGIIIGGLLATPFWIAAAVVVLALVGRWPA